MFAKRTLSAILCIVLCITVFAGCGKDIGVKYGYNKNGEIETLNSCVLADNDNLTLSWNNDEKGIILKVKKTGKEWKNFKDDGNSSTLTSTLDIYYQSQNLFNTDFVSGLDALKNNRVSVEKVKNGVKITYYFDSPKISVPITYVLRKDSMLMTVDGKEITENGDEIRLTSVVPSPALMSVDMEKKNSYIFVSDGIGALVDTKLTSDKKRDFTVGGANAAALSTSQSTDPYDNNGMRAFGLKDDKDAMFCIAEDTAGAVGIKVNAGDVKNDYSTVCANLYMVDADYTKGKAANSGEVKILSDRLQSKVSVGFYPLSGKDANYVGMAKCYREYLSNNGFLSEQKRDFSSPYAVTAFGGVMVTESILGVPTKKLKVATTFNDAKQLFSKFSEEIGVNPITRIKGYGETGLDIGKLGGGFKFDSKFGSKKDFNELQDYCKDKGTPLYTDFDIIRFSKSGVGFSYANDAAKTATLHAAEFSGVNVPLRDYNYSTTYRLLSRSKISSAIDKLISFADKRELSGVCLTYFGSQTYSDFSDIKYAVTGNSADDAKSYVNRIKDTGINVSGSASAYYAAGLMDTIFEAPLERSGLHQYMAEIPFYQMVYAGVVPMYSSPLNSSSNPKEKLMLAASSGTGLGFSVISNYETSYMESSIEKLYNCSYEYSVKLAKSSFKAYADIYKAIAGKKITKYKFLGKDKNLTMTEFENGVKVYANHSSNSVKSPVGKLEGYGFKMERGG